ncbi:hypothetical protein SISNIDRAFT_548964 [Sistotremastrum niveocremeum HHB9708]|uniref:Shr3 amino acid permease chaperone n=2 Tax=Sistotremastraceae TaxID=3402574 RepID=A0A164VRA5_9AGAM|nr:hypothetical protein SISNIDRAFT_548964 [Sistotremastrum niveocremeum HHB9708]KZT34893.1 hypothetical protein SISSUDRAFT_1009377 [Sistotremastrum suecicum HHB10207 ss-3]
MGFRQAAVLSSSSFFLGILFICFNIDHRILWLKLSTENIQAAYEFYETFYNAPPAVKALMHSMMGVGLMGLIGKLMKWDESALFFDGTSLAAFLFAITIYLSVTIPGLKSILLPASESLKLIQNNVEGGTEADRVEALRVMCAGNSLIVLCLVGVLCLQAGQEYARRIEQRERQKLAELDAKEAAAAAAGGEGTKAETKKDK